MARETKVDPSIAAQASDWWTRLHDEGVSPEEHSQFAAWVARSPERIEAYLDVVRLMRSLKSGRIRWPDTPVEELVRAAKDGPGDPLPLPGTRVQGEQAHALPEVAAGPPASPRRRPEQRGRGYRRYVWALAASLLLATAATWLWLATPQQYATRFGEQRSMLLADGSRVTLNTASRIEVDFRKNRRVVHLLEGEVLFDVAHDRTRPFDVVARGSVVRAIGTEFDVDLRSKETTLTVLEGRVAVMREAEAKLPVNAESAAAPSASVLPFPAPPGSLLVAAAQRVVITPAGPGVPLSVTNAAATTSWIEHQLVFDHTPLAAVAAQFNRYNRDQITVEGADLAGKEVTGVFRSDDPGSFLAFVSGIQGVRIRTTPDGSYIVTAQPASASRAH